MEFIKSVKKFNKLAGTEEKFDERKASLYVGLVLEEVTELLESLTKDSEGKRRVAWEPHLSYFERMSDYFKSGKLDYLMKNVDRVEFLDAAVDIMVVAAGAGIAIGGDVKGAAKEVCESNLSKYATENEGEYKVVKDENGKIKKGTKYFKPSLGKYLK